MPDWLCWYAASYLKILLSLLMLILSTETLAENIIVEGENMLSFCSSHLSVSTNLAWPLSFTPLFKFLSHLWDIYWIDRTAWKAFCLCVFWVFLWRGEDGTCWNYRINNFAIQFYLMISEKVKSFSTCWIKKANLAGYIPL